MANSPLAQYNCSGELPALSSVISHTAAVSQSSQAASQLAGKSGETHNQHQPTNTGTHPGLHEVVHHLVPDVQDLFW